jgi:hypothetical protein
MVNPWDVPEWQPIGDANIDTIYMAVGKTLSSWELAEEAVARLFGIFTSSTHQYPEMAPAIRAYGSVVSSKGRADMVLAAGKSFFYRYTGANACPIEHKFSPLINEFSNWGARRNDVAHGKAEHTPGGYYLFPGLYNTKKQPLGEAPAYFYTADQIANFGIAFEDLYDRLSDYATELDGWLHTWLQNTLAQLVPPSNQPP